MNERTSKRKSCNGKLDCVWETSIVESGVVPGAIESERLVWMSGTGTAGLTGLPCSLGLIYYWVSSEGVSIGIVYGDIDEGCGCLRKKLRCGEGKKKKG